MGAWGTVGNAAEPGAAAHVVESTWHWQTAKGPMPGGAEGRRRSLRGPHGAIRNLSDWTAQMLPPTRQCSHVPLTTRVPGWPSAWSSTT